MQVIITAAGRAARFGYTNKSMLPINGIPIIEHLVRMCSENNLLNIGIVVGETTYTNIMAHLRNGSKWGVEITYFFQDHNDKNVHYGFPSALYLTKNWAKSELMILCGDNFMKDVSLTGFADKFYSIEKHSKILVGCKEMNKLEGCNYAVLDQSLNRFVEKPGILNNKNIDSYLIDDKNVIAYAGPLVCEAGAIYNYIERLKPSTRGELEIVDLINMHKNVEPYCYDGTYFDIGSELNYAAAIQDNK